MPKFRFVLIIITFTVLVMASCKKEESYNPVRIESVWTNTVDTVTHTLTSININKVWIRLQGSGFTGLQKVLCNGFSSYINPNYVTDNSITFQLSDSIPTGLDVKVDSLKNTIKVITSHGSATYYNFILKDNNKKPTITSVSYTMPMIGDYITLDGIYLGETSAVYFPGVSGYIPAPNFTKISKTQIKVQVPDGAGASGAIKIICAGDNVYSPAYMYYTNGIFLKSFKESVIVAGGVGNVNYYNTSQLQTLTGLASNPDSALGIPTTAGTIAITTSGAWGGYFKFFANTGFQKVIDRGGNITGNTNLANLAIQFDLYVNQPWKSGVLALRMNKNLGGINAPYIYNIEPWTTTAPYTFENGWRTITVPFSNFTGLGLGTLASYISTIQTNAYQSLLGLVNQDVNADGHTPTDLTGFQMYIANVRLAPTTKPIN